MNTPLLSHLLDSSIDGVVAFDLELRYVEWSSAMERVSGLARDRVLGRPAGDIAPLFNQSADLGALSAAIAGDATAMKGRRFHFPASGRHGLFDMFCSPVRDDRSKVSGAMVIVRDVTERRQWEQLLEESELRFRTMADCSPVLLWMSREDSLCTFFNDSWLRFTGRTLDQEQGVGWAEGVHFEDLERCLDIYQRAFAKREPFEMEYRLKRADGEFRWILDRGTPRYDRDSTFRGYIGSCIDITARREAEAAVASSLQQLRAIWEAAAEGIVSANAEGIITSFNPAAERMFGYEVAEVHGRPISMLEGLGSGVSGRLAAGLRGPMREIEAIGRKKGGAEFPMEVAFGVAGSQDEPFTLIMRDVSERLSVDRLVLEAGESVQRRIGQDLHDGLGQLLTGTAFLAKDLERTALPGDPRTTRLIGLINQAIEQVKLLARGLSPPHLEMTDLETILRDLARETSEVFGVRCNFEAEAPVECDSLAVKTHLYRITREAIANAIRHGRSTEIQVAIAPHGERSLLSIRDNGSGIVRPATGRGLGLPSMRYRAKMIGGMLEIGPAVPRGTHVRIFFDPEGADSERTV